MWERSLCRNFRVQAQSTKCSNFTKPVTLTARVLTVFSVQQWVSHSPSERTSDNRYWNFKAFMMRIQPKCLVKYRLFIIRKQLHKPQVVKWIENLKTNMKKISMMTKMLGEILMTLGDLSLSLLRDGKALGIPKKSLSLFIPRKVSLQKLNVSQKESFKRQMTINNPLMSLKILEKIHSLSCPEIE